MFYTLFENGNGRTIREFSRQLCLKNNYEFNIKNVSSKNMLKASIESVIDTTFLEELLEMCLEIRNF